MSRRRDGGTGTKKSMEGFLVVLGIVIGLGLFLSWGVTRTFKGIWYKQECTGYLKRAADANTVELATRELSKALDYLDYNGLSADSGYTSIIYRTPDEDVGFWYENLFMSLDELEGLPPDADTLITSNALMKLRETILDDTKEGTKVTVPKGITVFPNNALYLLWSLSGLLVMGAVFGYCWLMYGD